MAWLVFILLLITGNTQSHSIQDYVQLARAVDWRHALLSCSSNNQIKLLDVGCGTGRWIETLKEEFIQKGAAAPSILFDLVDPSAVALKQAARKINSPFKLANSYQDIIQNVQLSNEYDVIWAIHSFYALKESEIKPVLQKCMNLLSRDGSLFVVLAAENSFYINCYNTFRASFSFSQLEQYLTAEKLESAALSLGLSFERISMKYDEVISRLDYNALSHFILNECIGYSFNRDGSVIGQTIEDLCNHPSMGLFLNLFIKKDSYLFPQEIRILVFKKNIGQKVLK